MKKTNKIIAGTLSCLMTSTMLTPIAANETLPKEEVVYIMTDANGNVDNINVVNIFNGGDIIDYGDYTAIKMLSTTEDIKQDADEIRFHSDAQKVYYQGTMKQTEIPWLISIRYFLDGKEYSPQEIVNKNGDLEIRISITRDEDYEGSYFDDYALQATFTLDSELCTNIVANGSTMANVGSNKQLTYTILPGKGLDTTIHANVKNFEMDGISINGIKLNLDVDVDTHDLTEKVDTFMAATSQLDENTKALYSGTEVLKNNGNTLTKATSQLQGGFEEWNKGVTSLRSGSVLMQLGLDSLNQKSATLTIGSLQITDALKAIQSELNTITTTVNETQQLDSASSDLVNNIAELENFATTLKGDAEYTQYKDTMAQDGINIDYLKNENVQGTNALQLQIDFLNDCITKMEATTENDAQIIELQAQIRSLENIAVQLNTNNALINKTENYMNELHSGMDTLNVGIHNLKTTYTSFDTEIKGFKNTLNNANSNLPELTLAINQLVMHQEALSEGLDDYTNGVNSIAMNSGQLVDGITSLAAGSDTMTKGTNDLNSGVFHLYDGMVTLRDGASKLADGTGEFSWETKKMNAELQTQIDDILSSIQGEETETISFVSKKNDNVDSLQFVIQTQAIKKSEPKVIESETQSTTSFRDKLLNLFKFE